jgi:nucleoid-associated protein YgaU
MFDNTCTYTPCYNPKQIIYVLLGIITVIFVLIAGTMRIQDMIGQQELLSKTTIVVKPGDTLWSIAQTYGPKHWDIRKTVEVIASINNISSAKIMPGDELLVPVLN